MSDADRILFLEERATQLGNHRDLLQKQVNDARARISTLEADLIRRGQALETYAKSWEGAERDLSAARSRVATLEARIAELTAERDEVFGAKLRAETTAVEQKEKAARARHSLTLEHDAARADRDEAVRLLRENPDAWQSVEVPEDDPAFGPVSTWTMCPHCGGDAYGCDQVSVCWGAKVRAYVALHPAQPEDCRGECERGKCATCWPETPTKGPR